MSEQGVGLGETIREFLAETDGPELYTEQDLAETVARSRANDRRRVVRQGYAFLVVEQVEDPEPQVVASSEDEFGDAPTYATEVCYRRVPVVPDSVNGDETEVVEWRGDLRTAQGVETVPVESLRPEPPEDLEPCGHLGGRCV